MTALFLNNYFYSRKLQGSSPVAMLWNHLEGHWAPFSFWSNVVSGKGHTWFEKCHIWADTEPNQGWPLSQVSWSRKAPVSLTWSRRILVHFSQVRQSAHWKFENLDNQKVCSQHDNSDIYCSRYQEIGKLNLCEVVIQRKKEDSKRQHSRHKNHEHAIIFSSSCDINRLSLNVTNGAKCILKKTRLWILQKICII